MAFRRSFRRPTRARSSYARRASPARRPATRRARTTGRRGQTVRIVLEHAAPSTVARPAIGMMPAAAPRRAVH